MDANDPRHGTRRGYYAHRRDDETACDPCKRAAATAEAARQLNLMRGQVGRIDATGTQRRLQALVALGWNWRLLGKHLDADAWIVQQWAEREHAYVFTKTGERVAELYERLSMQLPPETTGLERGSATRARNRAQRNGWVPPLCWDDIDTDEQPIRGRHDRDVDPVVVERILSGDFTLARKANKAERAEVVRRWRADGRSTNELERLTGWRPHRYIGSEEAA